ncbi:MAG: hypothetical protein Q4Q04_06295 [Methanocorpusculum sp.]|nr:hypothetical protein [Methanocorpusculum sp.]
MPGIRSFLQKDRVRKILILVLLFCIYLLERLIDKLLTSKL